jgi:hypothetical protein
VDKLLQGLTAGVAVAALIISFWQGYRTRLIARQANAGPVMASVYSQFRDPEFRKSFDALRTASAHDLESDFAGLPATLQGSAFTVCYFFEYIGLLVAFGHLDQKLVLDSMSTQLVEIWNIMQPAIAEERKTRSLSTDPYYAKRFLPHYEHLMALIALRAGTTRSEVSRQHGIYSLRPAHALFPQIPSHQVACQPDPAGAD